MLRILLAGVSLVATTHTFAEPGEYDENFGDSGVTILNLSTNTVDSETAWGVAQAPNGKYYIGGDIEINSMDSYFVLARFNQDGSLDTSFSFDGMTTANFNLTSSTDKDYARSIHVDGGGNIFLSGSAETASGTNMAVAKFLDDGSLDTSFSTDGKANFGVTGDPSELIFATAVSTDSSGFVYLAGGNTGSSKPIIVKLFPNGLLDNSFNLTGKLELDINGWNGAITEIHPMSDGKILVTGSVRNPSGSYNNEYFAAKVNANGSLDTSFNAVGYRIIPIDLFVEQSDDSLDSHVLDDGRLILTGATINGMDNGDYDMAAVKLNPDGSDDITFGTNGTAIITIGSGDSHADIAYGLDVQSDGKIVLCGFSGTSFSTAEPTFVRLMPDGSRDFDFGSFGVSVLSAEPTSMSTVVGQVSNCQIDADGYLMSSMVTISSDDSTFAISRVDLGLDVIFKDGFE